MREKKTPITENAVSFDYDQSWHGNGGCDFSSNATLMKRQC